LDKDQRSNYRPISNLSLISKIIERIVKVRLTDHLSSNNLLNPHQSVYCKHHYWNCSAVHSWSSHKCHRLTETILSLSSWPFCSIWYRRPWHSDYSPVFWFGIHGSVL